MKYSFLHIGAATESVWPLVLEQALAPLGTTRLASELDATRVANEHNYDIIIIDTGVVPEPLELIAELQAQQPKARIIVATSSPTWQRAREVFQAGAIDYIRKSLDKVQLQASIQKILQDPLQTK